MNSINFLEVNFTEIITFLDVSRTLNMSISADNLFISQPAVSKRIIRLEKTYGLILFIRGKKGLQLTPAGKVFYEELNASTKHIEDAFTKASIIQSGAIREFNIGYDGFFDMPLLYEIVEKFKSKYPGTNVNVILSRNESCEDLFTDQVDILLRPNSAFSSFENYVRSEPVSQYTFCILVPHTNPLSEKEDLTIDDIAKIPLTSAHIESNSPYLKTLKNIFLKHNHTPNFNKHVPHDMLCFQIIASSDIAIASPSFWTRMNARTAGFFQNKIKIYPIENEFYPVSFVWKTSSETHLIHKFLTIYRQVVNEEDNKQIVWESYNGPYLDSVFLTHNI